MIHIYYCTNLFSDLSFCPVACGRVAQMDAFLFFFLTSL
jgi:hypothetical protein